MSHADWRAPGAYDDLRSHDAPGFAWEYLSRNPDFQNDRRRLDRAARDGVLDPAEADAFARRWGVRFCPGQRGGPSRRGSVGRKRAAKRGRSDNSAG
jgi:hypothetical protein